MSQILRARTTKPRTVPLPALPTPRELAGRGLATSPLSRCRARLHLAAWRLTLRLRPALQRLLDLTGATAGLLALSPLLLLTAFAIRLESRGPVLFTQTRVGKRGRPFTMYKFRSMRLDAESQKGALAGRNESADGVLFKMKADPRVTRVGRLIRRLSIDELPQLLNIVKGDMSIVGPRPAVPAEVAKYDAEARKRLHTKPGLTCLWQISGRSELSFAEQVRLDIRYLAGRTLFRDIKIIVQTVPAVLGGKGAY